MRGYLRATFRISLQNLSVVSKAGDGRWANTGNKVTECVIDRREPYPYEKVADPIKELWDAGRSVTEIKEELGISGSLYDRGFKHWFTSRGLPVPDGRKEKNRLQRELLSDRLMPQVMELWHGDWLDGDIAGELQCHRATVHDAVVKW